MRVQYDDNQMDVIDKVNKELKKHDLKFVMDEDEEDGDGWIDYKLQECECESSIVVINDLKYNVPLMVAETLGNLGEENNKLKNPIKDLLKRVVEVSFEEGRNSSMNPETTEEAVKRILDNIWK